MPLSHRQAGSADCPLLAGWNHQLVQDEGHRNPMTVAQLETRLRGWLAAGYRAVVFSEGAEPVAYALYREEPGLVYLRQFFVRRDRRRAGHGREAMAILHSKIWPKEKRRLVEVLCHNAPAIAFWRAVGYDDYSLTLEIVPPTSHPAAHTIRP